MKGILLIAKEEIHKLKSILMNPRAVCQICDNAVDCIGIEDCYSPDYFQMIEFEIKDYKVKDLWKVVNN